jgi:hypothetical protein
MHDRPAPFRGHGDGARTAHAFARPREDARVASRAVSSVAFRESLARLVVPLLIVVAVADRSWRVDGVVDGEHWWRQAHVVANVDMMLQRGVFSVPSTWNDDMAAGMYDFPLYQGIVAVLTLASGCSPTLVAELLSVALFALVAILTALLARATELDRRATAWAVAFLALSPLARYRFAAPLPDDLALCASVASIVAWFAAARRTGRAAVVALGTAYAFAFVAALVKPPVHLPVASTIVVATWWRDGWRGLRSPRLVGFALTAALAVVTMRVIGAALAGGNAFADGATGWAWYFGSATERVSFDAHATVLARIAKQAVTTVGLGTAALLWLGRARTAPHTAVVLRVWSAAAVASSLLFLHVNVVHSYYQLPCTVPLALAAGGGAAMLVERVGAWSGRRGPGVAVAAVVLVGAAVLSEKYLARMLTPGTAAMRDAGAFVNANTPRDAFVVYGITADTSPAFLLFAQRHGRNVQVDAIAWETHHAAGAAVTPPRATFVYVPRVDAAARVLADGRWRQVAVHERGVLLTGRDG